MVNNRIGCQCPFIQIIPGKEFKGFPGFDHNTDSRLALEVHAPGRINRRCRKLAAESFIPMNSCLSRPEHQQSVFRL